MKNMEEVTWDLAKNIIIGIKACDVKQSINNTLSIPHLEKLCKTYLLQQFIKSPIYVNYTFQLNYLTQEIPFYIKSISSYGDQNTTNFFKCYHETIITIENDSIVLPAVDSSMLTFFNFGGNKNQINFLRNIFHNMFSSKTIQKLEGIIISGPMGSGKSFIGDIISEYYGEKCIKINVVDIKSKYRGETESNLKNIFNKASKRAPSILFLDDIDALCESRENDGHEGAITTILHLLDGAQSSILLSGVLVIATSSVPEKLDPALRRPGRLSQDIKLANLNDEERVETLNLLINMTENSLSDQEIIEISHLTPGFNGGDLRNLILEALSISDDNLDKISIINALALVRPVSLREFKQQLSTKTQIYGYKKEYKRILDILKLCTHKSQIFKDNGLDPPTRLFLYGPPGCGKTHLIKSAAAEFNLPIISVKRSNVLGKYFGESEKNLANIIKKAKNSIPCILLFENFEGLTSSNKTGNSMDVESRIINYLKVVLDGVESSEGIIIVAESNRPQLIDKNIVRPGRFHNYIYVQLPSEGDVKIILTSHLNKTILSKVDIDQISSLCKDMSVSHILQVIEEINKVDFISTESFWSSVNKVFETMMPNISRSLLIGYQRFSTTYGNT